MAANLKIKKLTLCALEHTKQWMGHAEDEEAVRKYKITLAGVMKKTENKLSK